MKNLEYILPETLAEITLEQYQRLQTVIIDGVNEIEAEQSMISILCNLTPNELRQLPKDDYDEASVILTSVLNTTAKWKQRFKLNGVEYGFIPNIDDITFGEYIDLDTFIKDTENLHKVMTILYRPITRERFGRYEIETYTGKEDTDIMKEAPMDAVQGAMVFFYHLGNELLRAIPNYLRSQLDSSILSNQTSGQNGDGIQASMELLKESLQSLTMQLPITYIKP